MRLYANGGPQASRSHSKPDDGYGSYNDLYAVPKPQAGHPNIPALGYNQQDQNALDPFCTPLNERFRGRPQNILPAAPPVPLQGVLVMWLRQRVDKPGYYYKIGNGLADSEERASSSPEEDGLYFFDGREMVRVDEKPDWACKKRRQLAG